ncbi:MAG: hypothetical protein IJC20_03515, partial [Clostridia bacterium]|nr:hypothetical protein [Clostridia bacterium]
MQDNRNALTNKSNTTRNNVNNRAVAVKKSSSVAKNGKKAVAKHNTNLRAVRAPRIVTVKKKDKAPFPWS